MASGIHGRTALPAWLGKLRARGFWLTERDVFDSDHHVCALSTKERIFTDRSKRSDSRSALALPGVQFERSEWL